MNALFQWQGVWHLMQQWHARPATSVGLSTSIDLLHFTRVDDALTSGSTTGNQCFDGSSSITNKGPMLMIDGGCGFYKKTPHESRCMESSGVDTGGVTAWPKDLYDPNLTQWIVQGPTKWGGCDGASGPSPNWQNPVAGKRQLVAGSHHELMALTATPFSRRSTRPSLHGRRFSQVSPQCVAVVDSSGTHCR